MSDLFKTSHIANAPREAVWDAWTKQSHLEKWFGPAGLPIFSSQMNFSKGGHFLYGIKTPDGGEMWGKWNFHEIITPDRLSFLFHFSDADGGVTRHPWSAQWPLEVMSTATFKNIEDGQTEIIIEWTPVNPTEVEAKTFSDAVEGMKLGWAGTFSQLDKFLG